MSTSDAQHSADLSAETVSAIANLARLSLNDTQSAESVSYTHLTLPTICSV